MNGHKKIKIISKTYVLFQSSRLRCVDLNTDVILDVNQSLLSQGAMKNQCLPFSLAAYSSWQYDHNSFKIF